jgi:hypothetical protein
MLLIMSTCHECLLVDSAARIGYKFIDNLYGIIKIEMQDNDGNKNSVL